MIAKYRKAEYPGEWWLTDFTMQQVERRLENLQSRLAAVGAERNQLKDWKEQMLLVESEWDAQEVGKLLGLVLGQRIRKNIKPKIEGLINERDRLKAENERLREALEEIENTWPLDGENASLMADTAKAALREVDGELYEKT